VSKKVPETALFCLQRPSVFKPMETFDDVGNILRWMCDENRPETDETLSSIWLRTKPCHEGQKCSLFTMSDLNVDQ